MHQNRQVISTFGMSVKRVDCSTLYTSGMWGGATKITLSFNKYIHIYLCDTKRINSYNIILLEYIYNIKQFRLSIIYSICTFEQILVLHVFKKNTTIVHWLSISNCCSVMAILRWLSIKTGLRKGSWS